MTKDTTRRVDSAALVSIRFFQLRDLPDLDALDARASDDARRPQFPGGAEARIAYRTPPLEVPLGESEIALEGGTVFADVTARVFDFGVVALAKRVLVGGMEWDRFLDRIEQFEAACRTPDALREEGRLIGSIDGMGADAVAAGSAGDAHLFVILRGVAGAVGADEAISDLDAVGIVAADRQPLSDVARVDVLRGGYSYHTDDLVLVGEERSFVLEGEPHRGVPDAIEAALAQRHAHRALRDRLAASDRSNGRRVVTGTGRLLERAELAVEVRGGGHLPGVYATARDRLRVADAELSAERRLAALRGTGGPSMSAVATIVGVLLVLLVVVLLLGGM